MIPTPSIFALAYRPNRITHHFFGHEMGVTFVNGANHCIIHEIP